MPEAALFGGPGFSLFFFIFFFFYNCYRKLRTKLEVYAMFIVFS